MWLEMAAAETYTACDNFHSQHSWVSEVVDSAVETCAVVAVVEVAVVETAAAGLAVTVVAVDRVGAFGPPQIESRLELGIVTDWTAQAQ